MADRRIYPVCIEEVVAKNYKNIEEEIVEIRERTAIGLGINGLHPGQIRITALREMRTMSYAR